MPYVGRAACRLGEGMFSDPRRGSDECSDSARKIGTDVCEASWNRPHRKGIQMFLRVDKLQVELPPPLQQDPNAAAALQELLGGKYGEMSTLNNYLFQSFNFRSKSKLRPFYSLVASITAEELGHVELVSNGVALLNNGPPEEDDTEDGGDISAAPYEDMK